ncbi:MAG: diacylglycerol kinase family lipid kinase [Clostridia bacterium]|nr:diacylglycerol kinase family lipid kinase [Clostridia bacterium]
MTTVFIINPKAGQGKDVSRLADKVRDTARNLDAAAEIYFTEGVGDATEYVKNYCETRGGARFIACGGDGTLSEVLNGAIGCADAEIGVIPMGTGNDFCRNFGTDAEFLDIGAQILGKAERCDAIKYTTWVDGEIRSGYCMNMVNVGFDCNVADMTAEMKKKAFVSGSMAYFLSILVNLVKKKGINAQIEIDGELVRSGHILLTSIANGSYCGGGIKSNPTASVKDGLMDINIIKNVSRLKFISLLPHYMKGDFPELKNIEKVISTVKGEKMAIVPCEDKIRICVDGEIIDAGKTEFEIVHNAIDFVVPAKVPEVLKC